MYRVYRQVVGQVSENTYIIENTDSQTALIIDPGAEASRLIEWIDQKGWQPQAICLTHGHFDHIGACDALRDKYHIPVYLFEEEADFMWDGEYNCSLPMLGYTIEQRPADILWRREDLGLVQVGDFQFEIRFTPGHSKGHVVFYFEREGFLISGDTIFKGSIGRTDLPGSSHMQLLSSIREAIMSLPESTILYPGHGPEISLKHELRFNPFLK